MVLPIVAVGLAAFVLIPYLMARELADNELLILVMGVVALAYVLKVAK